MKPRIIVASFLSVTVLALSLASIPRAAWAQVIPPWPFVGNSDAQTAKSTGQASAIMYYNGSTFDRARDSHTLGALDTYITNGVTATVNTPAPAPTVSPGLFQGVVLVCPSTSPAAVNGAYVAQCDSSGYVGVNVKNTPGVTVQNTPGVTVQNTPAVTLLNVTAVAVPATPSAAPAATAIPVQSFTHGLSSNGYTPFLYCDKTAFATPASSGYTELVAAVASKKVYVCGAVVQAAGTVNVKFAQGTKTTTACDTSAGDLSATYPEVANSGFTLPNSQIPWFVAAASDELCINLSASISTGVTVTYAQM